MAGTDSSNNDVNNKVVDGSDDGRRNHGNNDDTAFANCFRRIDDPNLVSFDDFLDKFERFGFYWFRLPPSSSTAIAATTTTSVAAGRNPRRRRRHRHHPSLPNPKDILEFLATYSTECDKKWSVENHGTYDDDNETSSSTSSLMKPSTLIPTLLAKEDEEEDKEEETPSSFYVSTIVHRQDQNAYQALQELLPNLDVFSDLHDENNVGSGGTWIFMGHHGSSSSENKKKRKRDMLGRAEHVDEVIHSGTYHVQLAGSKKWSIRPHPTLYDGDEEMLQPSILSTLPGAEQSETTQSWRLGIDVQEGDVFVLNTKIWYHYTEIPAGTGGGWSISIANDFYLPLPCPRDVKEGEVIFDDEEDIPEDIPRSSNPNCLLGEIDMEEEGEGSSSEEEEGDNRKIVLIALKDIAEGDRLSIAEDKDAGEAELDNASETVDPRIIANDNFDRGMIPLRGDGIPNELPRSLHPNCELVEDEDYEGTLCLRALEGIAIGEVLCILPSDDEEYEEVEVDLNTGEVCRDK